LLFEVSPDQSLMKEEKQNHSLNLDMVGAQSLSVSIPSQILLSDGDKVRATWNPFKGKVKTVNKKYVHL
jgi:hypothetical protein